MKKTIITLSIATIAYGGIYLSNNKPDVNPSNKVIKKIEERETKEREVIQVQENIKNVNKKIKKESIENRLKSIEIGKIENLKESRFLELEEEDLDKKSEKWFESFQHSEYLEDDYVRLSKDYIEDKIDDPHFNEILDMPIINYYKHLNDGNDYEVVNYAYFKYLKPNDFKMVFDEIQKEGSKNIKGFDFYLLRSKNDLKKIHNNIL